MVISTLITRHTHSKQVENTATAVRGTEAVKKKMKQNKKVVKCSTFICKTKHFEMFQIYPACLLNPLALKAPSVSQTPSPPLSHVHTRTQSRTNNCFYPPKRCFVSAARSPTI